MLAGSSRNAPVPVRAPAGEETIARIIRRACRTRTSTRICNICSTSSVRVSREAPRMRRANEWTQQKFREYGADRTDLESCKFGVGWTRGPMTLRMLAPQRRELLGVSWAWAPGTNGPLAGNVVYVDARTPQEYQRRFAGKLRGEWVMIGRGVSQREP